MDSSNANSEVALSSVEIKEEPLDIEPEPEDLINPAENVKVELEEEQGVKLETNAVIDPLANVQVHYTGEGSSSEPSRSSSRLAPSTSGQAVHADMDVTKKRYRDFVQLEDAPKSRTMQSAFEGRPSRRSRKYMCTDCGFTTSCKKSVISHNCKEEKEEFKCNKCNYVGVNKSRLKMHLRIQHPELYECDLCSYTSSTKLLMRSHITCFHGTTCFSCSLCEYKAKCQRYLLAHVRSKHPKVKPYECDACDRSFPTFHALGKHKLQEHGTQVHYCKICDYSTKISYDLVKHERKEHFNLVLESLNSGMLI